MYQYIRSIVPTWPEYVVQDWLYKGRGKNKNYNVKQHYSGMEASQAIRNEIIEMITDAGLSPNTNPWQLVPNMKFTMDMFEPKSKRKLIGRAGGTSDMGMGIPKDAERHATQAALIQQGGVSKEPAILIKFGNGYELLEGWHRTIQHFAKYPDGYVGPAYVAVAQGKPGVAENMDHSRDGRAVEELKSALLAKRDQLQSASDDQVYDIIDKIMTRIARSHSISGQKLHDMWVDKYKQIPDTWIMNEDVPQPGPSNMSTEDMIAYLRKHHDTNLHQDYLDHINTFSKFVLQNIPVNSIKTDLPKLDKAKVEQYKQMDFSKAPPIVIGGGYILDGYHRANVAKALGIPSIKAYVGVQGQQDIAENFADGKGPGRPGDSQRHGIPKKATMAELEKASHAKGRKGQLARWQLNMRRGKKK